MTHSGHHQWFKRGLNSVFLCPRTTSSLSASTHSSQSLKQAVFTANHHHHLTCTANRLLVNNSGNLTSTLTVHYSEFTMYNNCRLHSLLQETKSLLSEQGHVLSLLTSPGPQYTRAFSFQWQHITLVGDLRTAASTAQEITGDSHYNTVDGTQEVLWCAVYLETVIYTQCVDLRR